jgi:hypothetical protein
MRILTLVVIAALALLVAALVHAHDKHVAHPPSPTVLDVLSPHLLRKSRDANGLGGDTGVLPDTL